MKVDPTPFLGFVFDPSEVFLCLDFFNLFFSLMFFGFTQQRSVLFLAGQPAAPSEGAAPLCQVGQAEPGSVPGPARAAAAGH